MNGVWSRELVLGGVLVACSVLGMASARAQVLSLEAKAGEIICGVKSSMDSGPERFAEKADGMSGGGWSRLASGEKRLLILRVVFEDLPQEPMSVTGGNDLITGLRDYFHQASQGRFTLALPEGGSLVSPLLEMPWPAAFYGTNQLHQLLRSDAIMAAGEKGIDFTEFDLDLVVMGSVPGFAWNGLGNIGAPGAWLRNSFGLELAVHELGHNLGLRHANGWRAERRRTVGPGRVVEYGDVFDPMGVGGAENQYNARYKDYLGWLDEPDVVRLRSNGVYRLRANTGREGQGEALALVLPQSGGTNYWMEWRHGEGAHQAIEDGWKREGLQLRWGLAENQSSLLLDLAPASELNWRDSPLLAGQTFSDRAHGIHVTHRGPAGDGSEIMVVEVHRGEFVDNRAPIVSLEADRSEVLAGEIVRLRLDAEDPDDDPLSYHWQFGDGSWEADATEVTHAWGLAGDYVVRCVVSDRRGGQAGAVIVVRVGQAVGVRLAGSIRTTQGQPLAGVLVEARPGGVTWSDEAGKYTLGQVDAQSAVRLQAWAEGYVVEPDNFINPVVTAHSRTNLRWRAELEPEARWQRWIAPGSEWRYLDNGIDQGTHWRRTDFDDSDWLLGLAEFGYGDQDESTLIRYGPLAGEKHLTYYFRRWFTATDPDMVARLALSLLRDDGAVVYLNGTEVWRSNMPEQPVRYDSIAASAVGGGQERLFERKEILPVGLREGRNLIGVEVHQIDGDSSDISFNLALDAMPVARLPVGVRLDGPEAGSVFHRGDDVLLWANAWAGLETDICRVEYVAGNTVLGRATTRPFAWTWASAVFGAHDLRARAFLADGTVMESPAVTIHVHVPLIRSHSLWRYWDRGTDLGGGWTAVDYDDTDWEAGLAELGYGDGDEATVVGFGTDANEKPITTYFRRAFVMSENDLGEVDSLFVRLLRDDGAVVWLNGQELFRSNLPATGLVAASTRALEGIGDEEELVYHEFRAGMEALRVGTNVVAVEIHQRDEDSSDISFDFAMSAQGLGGGVAPRLRWERQLETLWLSWPMQSETWKLQESPGLSGPWSTVAGDGEVADNGMIRHAVSAVEGTKFYRLHRIP